MCNPILRRFKKSREEFEFSTFFDSELCLDVLDYVLDLESGKQTYTIFLDNKGIIIEEI